MSFSVPARFLCAVTLCGCLVSSCVGKTPDLTLSGEVMALAVAALGLTSYDKRNPPPPGVNP